MNLEYVESKNTICGVKALENRYNSKELKLFGKHGYIYLSSTGSICVAVTSTVILNRYFATDGFRYNPGSEDIFFFSPTELKRLMKILGIPKGAKKQLRWAPKVPSQTLDIIKEIF